MKKYIIKLHIVFMITIIISSSVAFAADALYRLMHNDHDALVIGEIVGKSEDKITVEVRKQIISSSDLNTYSPIKQIPLEQKNITIKSIKNYAYFNDTDSPEASPAIGDYILASINKEGFSFVNAWGIFKVDSLDYENLNIVFSQETSEYSKLDIFAIKTFINSNGQKNNFGFDYKTGEVLLGGEVIYKISDANVLPDEDTITNDISNSNVLDKSNKKVENIDTDDNVLLGAILIFCLVVIGVLAKLHRKI